MLGTPYWRFAPAYSLSKNISLYLYSLFMITKKEVERIAKLARLGLKDKEKKKFAEELSDILDFVNKLNQVKADKVEPTAQVTGLENITRQDKGRKKTKKETDKLLDLAPSVESRHVKVKAVL